MEAAGLAIGAAGLVSLFGSCLDALDRIDSFRDFAKESLYLQIQLDSAKIRLRQWGEAVGFQEERLSNSHHELLNDPEILALIRETLLIIRHECSKTKESRSQDQLLESNEHVNADRSQSRILSIHGSWRRKMAWSLRQKAKRSGQVERVQSLVQNLYDLVSPGHATSVSGQGKASPSRARRHRYETNDTAREYDEQGRLPSSSARETQHHGKNHSR